jgi:hypothetical protein
MVGVQLVRVCTAAHHDCQLGHEYIDDAFDLFFLKLAQHMQCCSCSGIWFQVVLSKMCAWMQA